MPIARRTPISRTRSTTPIVRVFTTPSAATRTATRASASKRPKTRPSASLTAPWIVVSGFAWSAQRLRRGLERRSRRGPGVRAEPDGEDVRAGDPDRVGRVAPADEDRLAAAARDGSLDDPDDPQVERAAGPRAGRSGCRRGGRRAGRRRRQGGPSRRRHRARSRAVVRSPATNVSRPSARKSAPTIAAASTRKPLIARSKVAIGLTRRHARNGREVLQRRRRPRRPGRMLETSSSPGTTSASQAVARSRAAWAVQPRATIIARPMTSAPSVKALRFRSRPSEPRASRSSSRRTRPSGHADDARHRRQQERAEEGRDEERAVDRDGPFGADRAGGRRPDGEGDHRDHDEDDGQPAQVSAPGGGEVGVDPEGLDRRDPRRAQGRLDRRRHRDPEAHEERDREAPRVEPADRRGEPRQGTDGSGHEGPQAPRRGRGRGSTRRGPGSPRRPGRTGRPGRGSRRRRAGGRPRGPRSPTVIDRVLMIRNEPTNRTMAAISAVVAWKSAVEARSPAARSDGEAKTYGSAREALPERGADGRGRRAGGEPEIDPRHAVDGECRLGDLERDDDGPTAGPDGRSRPGKDPDDP